MKQNLRRKFPAYRDQGETVAQFASCHCEAHVRRGNLFDNQWLTRLLRFACNDK
jgi:hypothetical protein